MKESEQHQNSKRFISNMMESTIRIGLLLMLIVWTFEIIKPFAIPVLWGAIVAVALMPLTLKLERILKGRKTVAAILVSIACMALLITPVLIVSNSAFDVIKEGIAIVQSGDFTLPQPSPEIAEIPLIGEKLFEVWASFAINFKAATMTFLPQIKSALTVVSGVVSSGFSSFIIFIISLIISGFFMAGANKSVTVMNQLSVRLVGKNGEAWTSLTANTIRSVLLGIVGVAFIQAVLIGSALFAFEIPAAGLFTFIIFVFAIAQLPPAIVVLPIVIYAVSTFEPTAATIFTIWVLIGGLSDNVLKPILMGRGVNVPMIVVFIGAIGGMLATGIIGLFLGAVVLSIWYELFITWLNNGDVDKANAR